MNKKEWQAIEQARDILKLGDKATLGEIKRAYHHLCRENHPDLAGGDKGKEQAMYRITSAYELLMRYCHEYRFPLTPEPENIYDADEWWMDRFGSDPLWGPARRRR